jgi:hypothetical protein
MAKIEDFDRQWRASGVSSEKRARRAWQIRHDARLRARTMMAGVEAELLRLRDFLIYRNPDGPTFEQLVARAERRACPTTKSSSES